MKLMGEPENGDKNQLIFPLPSHTMCLKALRHWTARAGIEKHITWHCVRHSFAVNQLNNGANIMPASNTPKNTPAPSILSNAKPSTSCLIYPFDKSYLTEY